MEVLLCETFGKVLFASTLKIYICYGYVSICQMQDYNEN